jgi:hypothetical protein
MCCTKSRAHLSVSSAFSLPSFPPYPFYLHSLTVFVRQTSFFHQATHTRSLPIPMASFAPSTPLILWPILFFPLPSLSSCSAPPTLSTFPPHVRVARPPFLLVRHPRQAPSDSTPLFVNATSSSQHFEGSPRVRRQSLDSNKGEPRRFTQPQNDDDGDKKTAKAVQRRTASTFLSGLFSLLFLPLLATHSPLVLRIATRLHRTVAETRSATPQGRRAVAINEKTAGSPSTFTSFPPSPLSSRHTFVDNVPADMVTLRMPFKRQDSVSGAVDPSVLAATSRFSASDDHKVAIPDSEKDEKDVKLDCNVQQADGPHLEPGEGFMDHVEAKDLLENGKERPIEVRCLSPSSLSASGSTDSHLSTRTDAIFFLFFFLFLLLQPDFFAYLFLSTVLFLPTRP